MNQSKLLPTSLTESVRPCLDEVRARAGETEAARNPLPASTALVQRLGLVGAFVPRRYGGLEADLCDWLQALRLLASADMSVAWLAGLAGAHSFVVSKFDARVQDEIWGKLGASAMVCSATALVQDGLARRVEGGIRVSGRWRFSSGAVAADWTMLFLKIEGEAGAPPQNYWALLPRSDYRLEDTWFIAGMKGTGSQDVIVSDAFVPTHRLGGPGMEVNEPGRPSYDNPLYTLPFRVMFPILFAPVVLGGAEGAVDLYRQGLAKRKAALSGIPLVDSPLSHVRLAEAVVRLRAVAALLEANWRRIAAHAASGDPVTAAELTNWRAEQSFAGREAVRTVDAIMERAGSSVYYDDQPLQRFWRDLHVGGGHARFDTDLSMQMLGRDLLGLPQDPRWI